MPAYEEVKGDPILHGFADSIANGIPGPNIPEMSTVWSIWNDAMELIGKQQLGAPEALHQAAEKLRETLGCK